MTADEIARIAVCEQRISEAEEDIRKVYTLLEGPPRDESIRGRLHVLETSQAAAKAATAAVEAVKLVQSTQATRRFSRAEKLAALTISVCFLALQTVSLIYVIGSYGRT